MAKKVKQTVSEKRKIVSSIAKFQGLTYEEWLEIAEDNYIKENFSLIADVMNGVSSENEALEGNNQ